VAVAKKSTKVTKLQSSKADIKNLIKEKEEVAKLEAASKAEIESVAEDTKLPPIFVAYLD